LDIRSETSLGRLAMSFSKTQQPPKYCGRQKRFVWKRLTLLPDIHRPAVVIEKLLTTGKRRRCVATQITLSAQGKSIGGRMICISYLMTARCNPYEKCEAAHKRLSD
jgi:hypothetical protein